MKLEFTENSLSPNLRQLMPAIDRGIYQIARFHQGPLLAKARNDAPWQDQTGNARSGLQVDVIILQKYVYALVLYHTVKYGIWLEVRFAGKNAIIGPTIRAYYPIVLASMDKLLERMDWIT